MAKCAYENREMIRQIYADCGDGVFHPGMTRADTTCIRACRERGWVKRGKMAKYPGYRCRVREWQLTELGVKIATGERKR